MADLKRFSVLRTLSNEGGMGTVYLVEDPGNLGGEPRVLKACKVPDAEGKARFRREVRVLIKFQGNTKVAEIVEHDLDSEPPAFVMRYYPEGDLRTLIPILRDNIPLLEHWFGKIIDCVSELHQSGVFHRDIKPQNFLRSGHECVISDFGLCVEHDSSTVFTRRSQSWGTEGYAPPEFSQEGGFANAKEPADIFMIGRTFYHLLTGRDPRYVTNEGIPLPLHYVIDRCMKYAPEQRFPDLSSLKQALNSAFDVLLGRHDGYGRAQQQLGVISGRLETDAKYSASQILEFVTTLQGLGDAERNQTLLSLPDLFFDAIGQEPCQPALVPFLPLYKAMLEEETGLNFGYAETVAKRVGLILRNCKEPVLCALAVQIAVEEAERMNRYAAMDTCGAIVRGITEPNFGFLMAQYIREHPGCFLANIEPWQCKSPVIRDVLTELKNVPPAPPGF